MSPIPQSLFRAFGPPPLVTNSGGYVTKTEWYDAGDPTFATVTTSYNFSPSGGTPPYSLSVSQTGGTSNFSASVSGSRVTFSCEIALGDSFTSSWSCVVRDSGGQTGGGGITVNLAYKPR